MTKASIKSPNSGHVFQWRDDVALALGCELTPILAEMAPSERIAAMAYQIGVAAQDLDGLPDHECLDDVKADLMAELVRSIVKAGFVGLRKVEAELTGRDGGGNGISGTYEACNG